MKREHLAEENSTPVNPVAQRIVDRIRPILFGLGRVQYEWDSPKVGQEHLESIGLKTVEADGTMLSYLEAGNPKSKNKYFFIAGWPISAPSWDLLMQKMAPPGTDADIHLVAITLPGLGSSDPIMDGGGKMNINRDNLIKTLVSAIDKIFYQGLNQDEIQAMPVNVIGHSTGALLAMVLLEKYPDKIKNVVAMAPPWSEMNREQILSHHLPRAALYKFLRSEQWVLALLRRNIIHNLVSNFMLGVYEKKYGYLMTDHQEFLTNLVIDMEKMHMQAALQLASVVLEGGDWVNIQAIRQILAEGGHQIKLVCAEHDRAVDPRTTKDLYHQLTAPSLGAKGFEGVTSVMLEKVRKAGHDMVFSHASKLAEICLS